MELTADALRDDAPLAAGEAAPSVSAPAVYPVLEVLDRDGQVRQMHRITDWPLTVGRALDNELPLSDPHVAAHHLRIAPVADDSGQAIGLRLEALDSINGVQCGCRRLQAGESQLLTGGAPLELQLGATRLRLRLLSETLADEVPLPSSRSRIRRFAPILAAALLALFGFGCNVWLASDPDTFGRALGSMLISVCLLAACWCGIWAVLSKVFTRQAQFGWHLKVLLLAVVAWLALMPALDLLAFSLSWPWVSDFSFIVGFVIIALALYHHLRALEIFARPNLLRALMACGLLATVGITLWLHHARTDRFGDELYMSHLFPPALRLARAQPVGTFVDALAPLQARLDAQAKKKARDDDSDDDGADD